MVFALQLWALGLLVAEVKAFNGPGKPLAISDDMNSRH